MRGTPEPLDHEIHNYKTAYHHPNLGRCYHCKLVQQIQLIYILAAIIWLAIIYWAQLYKPYNIITWGLLSIPLFVFGLGFYYAEYTGQDIEDLMFQANYLSFGFMITAVLINWNHPKNNSGKAEFFQHIVLAFILMMMSMIDVWVSRERMTLVYHIQSILQTMALVILSIALFQYYTALSHIEMNNQS